MGYRVKVRGREALMKKLEALAPDVAKAADPVKLQVMKEVADAVASRAPYETGELAESYEAGYLKDNPDVHTHVSQKASKDPYAVGLFGNYIWRFIEFGTNYHSVAKGAKLKSGKLQDVGPWMRALPARPHVYPTWRAMRPKAKRAVRSAVNKAVKAFNSK